jgi:BRO1-like domain
MLILPLKVGVRYDLSAALARWLDNGTTSFAAGTSSCNHTMMNPLQFILPKPDFTSGQCRMELLRLQGLRNCLTDALLKPDAHTSALMDSSNNALTDCYEYHAVLLEFEKRGFPVCDDETTPLQMAWKEAFASTAAAALPPETHATLVWDRACTAYNTLALLTAKAAASSVTDRDECKQAVGYCQQAASIASVLKELCPSQQFRTVDLSTSLLQFWESFLLAEAQGFIYRMASLAEPSNGGEQQQHSTLAVLSQSVHQLFAVALPLAQDPRLVSEVSKPASEWGAYCKAVSMLAAAKAEYHQSVVCRLGSEWGKEIAYLRDCESKCKECEAFIHTLSGPAATAVSYTKKECLAIRPVVTDRLHEADRDNYRLYHCEIPTKPAEIEAKQLSRLNPQLPTVMLEPQKALFTHLR